MQYKNNESWTELGLEYEDIQNLAATPAGVITWALPQSTDNTRTAIVLCRATKDISNMDYVACLADATITKTTLAQNATSNTYSGLTNSTQYWVKAFVKYTLGGKEFYSGGVTVTFTTLAISEISNLSVNPATELVTWTLPSGSNHTNVEICYSKTNISGYTYAQCQADSNVTKVELTITATSYTVNVLDKITYYVKVFLRYSSGYSNGVVANWQNPKQWFYKAGNENIGVTGGWKVGFVRGSGFQSKTSTQISMNTTSSSVEEISVRAYEITNAVDLSGINTLKANISIVASGIIGACDMGVVTAQNQDPSSGTYARIANQNASTQVTLDVSSISVSRYIAISSVSANINSLSDIKIYNIWGE